ncbi:cation diffusion facilitator family transporter [Paracoccus bogoriensis]|uniref:cation diffusion facilitator family transporter n=1 Tax=Paracoccus bogoriensis TaxID=242065 RepID=UPI001C6790E0|nr:cation diffusion facilitator family transporter [Paracoccus bogoriensis]MBW7057774.1 cation diffusion facilitator family transporter [Paracoccus bogoriensis]
MTTTMKLAAGSILLGLAVLALKTLAWWLTGSVALLSDALESIVNVAAAIAALVAIRVAQRPADQGHPYGHHKAEFISAVIEGVLIILAALLILHQAWGALQSPRELEQPGLGLAVNALASALNGLWCWVLIRQGRRRRSPALVADGKHLMTDVISSLGVLAGIGLALATGWMILDPILAMLVGVNILWSGWKVVTASVSGLMDEAVSDRSLSEIRQIISDRAEGAIEAHDLRTRHAGRATFIDFHLVVDGQTTVAEAHDICDRIEAALKENLPDAQITIHVEPEHKAKHSGVLVI